MKIFTTAFLGLLVLLNVFPQKYNSLFWEISGNGLEKPSYLYGTMHAQDERVFQFKKGVMKAFKAADIYAMELNMDSINQATVIQQLIMDSTYTLQTLLNEEDYQLLDKFFQDSLGQSIFLYNKMQPMFVASMMGQRKLQKQREEALDLYFHKLAKEQGKQVVGLEKLEEQVAAFSSIPYNQQANMLVEAMNQTDSMDYMMYELMKHYVAGNLDSILDITKETEYGNESFTKIFLTDRNIHMAERVVPYMEKGSVFIAVGAAHLPGEQGVIELLKKKGYNVVAL